MSTLSLPSSLWVYIGEDRVGTLYPGEALTFEYSPEWISGNHGALHPQIQIADGKLSTPQVQAFFENLLPEGDQRKLISQRYQVTSVFGLLTSVGGDTAGSIVLLPEGQVPAEPAYQDLTWEQVNTLVHTDVSTIQAREAIEAEAAQMPTARVSISGAQFKLLLLITPEGLARRPMGASPSTHILKPDMMRHDIPVFATAANETIVMRAAQICGLPTANTFYQPIVNACLVERYDRILHEDGKLERLWQADFCQLLGKSSDVKYEQDGGPDFKDCYTLLTQSAQPAVDKRYLLLWLFFNLYVGNNDSHAKNLSMLAGPDGMRLAPFYDLMNTRLYAGLGPNFAFRIGGEFEPGKMGGEHLRALSESLDITLKYTTKIAAEIGAQIEAAIAQATAEILPVLDSGHKVIAERLAHFIHKNVKQLNKRFDIK
jgi:serine/threonine-protein kinase HipA